MTLTLSNRNTAHAVLLALESAEANLMPQGSHSRLYAAIIAADSTVAFYANPSLTARHRLSVRLEDLQRIESDATAMGHLPVGSLMQRGISLGIHITQAALADAPPNAAHVLEEARQIVRLSARSAA